jgi:serine/threonine protein kinase
MIVSAGIRTAGVHIGDNNKVSAVGSSFQPSPGHESRPQRIERLVNDCLSRRIAGEIISIDEIGSSHADLMPELAEALRKAVLIDKARRRAKGVSPDSFMVAGYDIIRQIRRGGQGVVFEAVQRSTGRTVAIKWMRDGSFAGAGERMRFEREVRVLAQLNHPNIVTIHDSGVTPTGDNYFVMNYIAGMPLDEYVERIRRSGDAPFPSTPHERTQSHADAGLRASRTASRPSVRSDITQLREGLKLFQKVCDAVHTAHLRGIIHRDLKPSNIRVDERGEPHVLDFGLAKVIDPSSAISGQPHESLPTAPRISGASEFTQSGQFIGSLPWASPEQVEGRTDLIDIRTDVYSLGVIFFQMLTGRFPYPVLGHIREVMDHITRTAPTRPRSMRPALDDEIETIVLKCLAKEPERRYQSAGELARDLDRYLAGDAIEAKRDSIHYVLRKQLRRYRVPLGVAAAFILLVITGLGASLYLWQQALAESSRARNAERMQSMERARAERARAAESEQRRIADQRAEQARGEAAKSRAALDFVAEMFGAIDPVLARGHNVTVAEVLDPAADKVARAFADQPQAEVVVRGVLGQAYGHVARYKNAIRELQRAWELRQSLGRTDDAEALSLQHDLALAMLQTGDLEHSREILQRVLQKRLALLGPESRDTLATRSVLGLLRQLAGDVAGAITDTRAVLADQERTLGRTDRDTLDSMASLADMLESSGKLGDALAVAHDAAQRASSAYGADSNVALMTRSIEAETLLTLDRYNDATSLLDQVIRGKEKLYGENHPSTLLSLDLLATALRHMHLDERAIALGRTIVSRANQSLGERDPTTLVYINNLAQTLRQTGQLDEAEATFRRLVVLQREVNGAKGVSPSPWEIWALRQRTNQWTRAIKKDAQGFRGSRNHGMIGVAAWAGVRPLSIARGRSPTESHAFLEKALGPRRAFRPGSLPDLRSGESPTKQRWPHAGHLAVIHRPQGRGGLSPLTTSQAASP